MLLSFLLWLDYWTRWYTGFAFPSRYDYKVTPPPAGKDCAMPYAIQAQTLQGVSIMVMFAIEIMLNHL